jgi:zinc protease
VDPNLFQVYARVKNPADMDYVRDQILAAVGRFREEPVPADKLEAVKNHLRYGFSLRMDNSEEVANTVARYVALRRTPATIDKLYAQYAVLTPEVVQRIARKYLTENGRTIVTLTGGAK